VLTYFDEYKIYRNVFPLTVFFEVISSDVSARYSTITWAENQQHVDSVVQRLRHMAGHTVRCNPGNPYLTAWAWGGGQALVVQYRVLRERKKESLSSLLFLQCLLRVFNPWTNEL